MRPLRPGSREKAARIPLPFAEFGLLLSYFIAYLLVLSWADYSYVQPASSASYVLIALLAHFVLHETISPVRWLGVAVICTGVFVVGHTHPKTPEHHSWS